MRITEKKENGFYELKKGQEIYGEENGIRLVQIVGQYEDIKEELGVEFYQLIINGYFYRYDILTNSIVKEELKDWFIDIKNKRLIKLHYFVKDFKTNADIIRNTFETIKFSDYGKKGLTTDWALTKEELL